MAKIIFSFQSNIIWDINNPLSIDAYYEGFIDELKKCGHEVLVIRTNDLLQKNKITSNKTGILITLALLQKLKTFSPDLIITANHSVPTVILDNTTCPIIVLNSDSVVYYNCKEYIKNNIERYYFFHFDKYLSYANEICKICNAKIEQNYFLGNATTVRCKKEDIKHNIVFMGTFGWPQKVMSSVEKIKKQKDLIKLIEKYNDSISGKSKFDLDSFQVATINERIKILDALSDLELKIYCYKSQAALLVPYSMNLLKSCDITPVYSVKDIEKTYNSSLIAPTLPNAQTLTGFSWRVTEVMASNACLISSPSKELMELFPFIPIYNSPAEARELCKKLLLDNSWRNEIVAQSQEVIEKDFRFVHVLRRIENATGINLTNNKENSLGYIDNSLNEFCIKQLNINKKSIYMKILKETSKILPYFITHKFLREL